MPDARGARGESGFLRWGFVGPALLLLLALNVFPLFYNLYLSFTNAQLTGMGPDGRPPRFVGTANYEWIFADPDYAAAVRRTALFVVLAVTAELLLGFGVALALRDRFPGKTVVLTVLLVPMMLSPAVMGMFWKLILNGSYGALNHHLGLAGLPQPQWITDPGLRLVSILIIDVWMWTPFMMLIALAGLNSIPRYLYEAAEIDRAGRWTVFRRITLPMCAPLLLLAVLFRLTDALKQFDYVMAITGADDAATQTLSALLYRVAVHGMNVGRGSAYGCVLLVAIIALATVFTRYIDYIQARQGRASA
jgi:multiple sugar transport system permease protein